MMIGKRDGQQTVSGRNNAEHNERHAPVHSAVHQHAGETKADMASHPEHWDMQYDPNHHQQRSQPEGEGTAALRVHHPGVRRQHRGVLRVGAATEPVEVDTANAVTFVAQTRDNVPVNPAASQTSASFMPPNPNRMRGGYRSLRPLNASFIKSHVTTGVNPDCRKAPG